uniref:Lys2 n=2 Tax=Enterobacteriaceae TaxID=543 RepID=Q06B25_ECOLX|nr:Lys2 [Escherichia coli]AKJ75477.1 lys2 [Shigella sonnei]prf//1010254B ORF 2 [Escherichia coli]prf//1208299C ORF 2 hic region [Escherichia coli]
MNAGCLWMNGWHSFTTRSRYEKNNRDYFIASCSHYSVCMSGKLYPGCSGRDRISVINS